MEKVDQKERREKLEKKKIINIVDIIDFHSDLIDLILLLKKFYEKIYLTEEIKRLLLQCLNIIAEVDERISVSKSNLINQVSFKYNTNSAMGSIKNLINVIEYDLYDKYDSSFFKNMKYNIAFNLSHLLGIINILDEEKIANAIMNILNSQLKLTESTRKELLTLNSEISKKNQIE